MIWLVGIGVLSLWGIFAGAVLLVLHIGTACDHIENQNRILARIHDRIRHDAEPGP